MNRLTLERNQIWIYLSAIIAGLWLGDRWPALAQGFGLSLWPVLVILLYATFVQIPLLHLRAAFRNHRFAAAMLIGNFVALPVLVWALVQWLPIDPVLRLGVLLVLLVPCTDWFITFTQLGGGNVALATATTPLNLLMQLLLLPLYLWLYLGGEHAVPLGIHESWPALLVVVVPLIAAAVTERWIRSAPQHETLREQLAWLPVPLLALVVFLIAGAQASVVREALGLIPDIVPVFVAFALTSALLAKALACAMQLPADQGRTLAFSMGTRNSFVVLPFALALPAGLEVAAVVIVVQSLVELVAMVFYLWWVPRRLFR